MHQTDQALIDETRAGSQAAFGVLMERYQRLVFRVGFSYAREENDALDIAQNVFIKVYQKLDSFQGKGSFKSWLIRITHNESLDWIQKHRRLREHEEITTWNAPPADASQDADVLQREHRELLLEEMLHLNPKQRMAVSLRYFEDLRIREIADVLECSEGVVKSILFRSLEKLRNRLTLRWRNSDEGLSRLSGEDSELHRG